ncbi:MAG: DUF3667 domain-containing protein [Rhodothermales bacterium]|nr:DUF3667 domain-containing protein [Rhodothermales bacterium]
MSSHTCPNCGSEVGGPYCGNCGQPSRDIRQPITHFAREIVSEYFGLDGKLLRSIGPLLFLPGKLTIEYLNGRVQRYVRPVRLYLTASLLFFFLVAVLDPVSSVERAWGDQHTLLGIDSLRTTVQQETARRISEADSLADAPGTTNIDLATGNLASGRDSVRNGSPTFSIDLGDEEKTQRIAAMTDAERTQWLLEILGRFLGNLPKLMFVMLPVFALLLKLVYVRSKRFYGEHLVFTLHVHAFIFVNFTLLGLLTFAPAESGWTKATNSVLSVGIPIYVFLAQKRVYEQGWFKTGIKFALIMLAYSIAMLIIFGLAASAMLVLGA